MNQKTQKSAVKVGTLSFLEDLFKAKLTEDELLTIGKKQIKVVSIMREHDSFTYVEVPWA